MCQLHSTRAAAAAAGRRTVFKDGELGAKGLQVALELLHKARLELLHAIEEVEGEGGPLGVRLAAVVRDREVLPVQAHILQPRTASCAGRLDEVE